MSLAARLAGRFVLGLVFAFVGALTGLIAAAMIGALLTWPAIAPMPGMGAAYALLMLAGAALGAIGGLIALYRL